MRMPPLFKAERWALLYALLEPFALYWRDSQAPGGYH
jgi:hypothetical protein